MLFLRHRRDAGGLGSAAAAEVSRPAPLSVTMESALTMSFVTLSVDSPRVVASTVMALTTVRPMASAEAVAPVRRGLRTAFRPAGLPETPKPRHSSGRTTAITGRESNGTSTMTPVTARMAPNPTSALPSEPPAPAPATTAAAPSSVTMPPSRFRISRDLVVAGRCALPIAATGGIFAARRAGSQAASTVTRTPTTAATWASSTSLSDQSPCANSRPASPPTRNRASSHHARTGLSQPARL
ncbi:hypothetical protein ACKI1J_11975 [Streptomyces scabiei]|uniref:hypothetical protein n=1 Tax=Streptomyces scabiei TaxID=1930 RepID=UPI0038F628EE